jgi:HAE1 family hydrophobic/amphiphilic exporter-1
MFFGTVFGVMVVPGLYYIFGTLSEGKALIRDEDDESLTEKVSHHV